LFRHSSYRRWKMKRVPLVLLLMMAAGHALAEKVLFSENFSRGISAGWKNVAFFKKKTEYSVVHDGTNDFLRGVADHACSALSTKLNLAPPAKLILRWRWKIDGVNTNGSERDLKKFDHAARVFVAFDTFIGPPRSLNYVWGDVEKPGTLLPHPGSGRAQIFVIESGNASSGCWVTEQRDVAADWQKAFPGRTMPKIIGLGVMTDSDSLGQQLSGDYADIELVQE
ncbi:MAG TPA: DUF3047 domain-containing protein, partial [Candidatus Binatia bacterium]|nr:DUF3047 domain-containing protein [Candidatus Binatia bacterium]